MAQRPLREDVQDKADPVDDPAPGVLRQIAFLGGRQGMIKDNHIGPAGVGPGSDFIGLAPAHEEIRLRRLPCRGNGGGDVQTGRARQFNEFRVFVRVPAPPEGHMHDQGARDIGVVCVQMPAGCLPGWGVAA